MKRFMRKLWNELFPPPPPECSKKGELLYKQHQAGWFIVDKNQPIVELEFIRIDPPFYLFKVHILTTREQAVRLMGEKAIRLAGDSVREWPLPGVRLVNRHDSNLQVDDEYFFIHWNEEEEYARIRDLR